MNAAKPSLVEIPETPQPRSSRSGAAYTELKRRILSGLLAPGAHLLERELCADLNVSRTPLREALNRLANEDLLDFRTHHGYVVTPVSAEDFRRLRDLRVIVEPRVAGLAALRASPEDVEALRATADMPELVPGDDASFVAFCRANARFHLQVVRAAGNPMLENLVMAALDQYQRPAYLGIGRATDDGLATRRHQQIVEAIAARDPYKAEAVMSHHVMGGSDRIIRALEEAGL